jgi:hypothetical protein
MAEAPFLSAKALPNIGASDGCASLLRTLHAKNNSNIVSDLANLVD